MNTSPKQKPPKPIALVDCNNFFVSCERVFQPELRRRPTVVISGKDGCVIARSNKAKACGIAMGQPIFLYKDLIKKHGVLLRQTNFALYTDISKRIMMTLRHMCMQVEQYSIDEAFCTLGSDDCMTEGHALIKKIARDIGMPVSVGIASTKTLAKIATDWAKQHAHTHGVSNLYEVSDAHVDDILKTVDVHNVWGIGPGHTGTLRAHGITTAYDLKMADITWARQCCGIGVAGTIAELRGQVVIPLGTRRKPPKSMMCTRSFRIALTTKQQLAQMLALYVTRAAQKLRRHGLQAGRVTVQIRSGRFAQNLQYSKRMSRDLHAPTAYTPELISVAGELLDDMYKEGVKYKKVGVHLALLTPYTREQLQMFVSGQKYTTAQKKVMRAQDILNKKYGTDTIRSAAMGMDTAWTVPESLQSQRFTTQWEELLVVKI